MGKTLQDWDWVDKRKLSPGQIDVFIEECKRRLGAIDEGDCHHRQYTAVRLRYSGRNWVVGGERLIEHLKRDVSHRYAGLTELNFEEKLQNDHEEEEKGMNLTTAALIAQEDITTCQVVLEPEFVPGYVRDTLECAGVKPIKSQSARESDDKHYDYILHASTQASVGDLVLVHARDTIKTGHIVSIDREPRLDPAKSSRLNWVLGKPQGIDEVVKAQHRTKRLAEKLEERRRTDIRSQVLQSFGVESAAQLLEDGSDDDTGQTSA